MTEIIKTYKYKIYSSKKNRFLNQQADIAGIIWNHCIALQRRHYRMYGKMITRFNLEKHINKVSKLDKFIHFRLVANTTRSNIIRRIHLSYEQFFRKISEKQKASPPKFQKVKKYKSFSFVGRHRDGWRLLDGNKIRIRKRDYSYHKSREIPSDAKIKTMTVKRNNLGEFFIYIVVSEEISIPEKRGNAPAGFDFGLKTFLTDDRGNEYRSPLFLKQSLAEIKRLHRSMSLKTKGSNNYEAARKKFAKAHEKVFNQRKHHFYQLAHELTDKHDELYFEDLCLTAMIKLWGRKVYDLSFSSFMQILEHVAKQKGVLIHKVDRFFPSTKTCSECGTTGHKLSLADRTWECPDCQTTHNRDINAAKNILMEGTSSSYLGDRRPEVSLAVAA